MCNYVVVKPKGKVEPVMHSGRLTFFGEFDTYEEAMEYVENSKETGLEIWGPHVKDKNEKETKDAGS